MSDDEMRRLTVQSLDRSYCPGGAARQMAAALAAGDRRSSLARIAAPTVVLHGQDDPLVPVECGIDTAKHIPGAELRIVPGMGHDFPLGSSRRWPMRSAPPRRAPTRMMRVRQSTAVDFPDQIMSQEPPCLADKVAVVTGVTAGPNPRCPRWCATSSASCPGVYRAWRA